MQVSRPVSLIIARNRVVVGCTIKHRFEICKNTFYGMIAVGIDTLLCTEKENNYCSKLKYHFFFILYRRNRLEIQV